MACMPLRAHFYFASKIILQPTWALASMCIALDFLFTYEEVLGGVAGLVVCLLHKQQSRHRSSCVAHAFVEK